MALTIANAPNGERTLGNISSSDKLPMSGDYYVQMGVLREWVIQDTLVIDTDEFNSVAGVSISLPTAVSSVDDYQVIITQNADSGFIGDIWVEKTTSGFTVYNSGSEDSAEFTYIIIYG